MQPSPYAPGEAALEVRPSRMAPEPAGSRRPIVTDLGRVDEVMSRSPIRCSASG